MYNKIKINLKAFYFYNIYYYEKFCDKFITKIFYHIILHTLLHTMQFIKLSFNKYNIKYM